MADKINTADHKGDFTPRPLHPAGSFIAQCVDVIDLGKRPETYEGADKGAKPKFALVFRTGELDGDGKPMDVSKEYTISVGPKATLRKDLEAWRGKPYEDEYPDIPLDKFEGVWATLSVGHVTSKTGREYAKIIGIGGIPKGVPKPESYLPGYQRPDFWTTRKAEYQKEYEAYLAAKQPSKPTGGKGAPAANWDDFPPPQEPDEFDEDSSLPF
jgi:hypothetical protein